MLPLYIAVLCFQFSLLVARSDITPRAIGNKNICENFRSCSECLRREACEWCPTVRVNLTDRSPQCHMKEDDATCPGNMRETFVIPELLSIENETLGSERFGHQLQPQKLHLRIGPHTPKSIRVKYKRLEGYPVDLYFIMDLSTSMKKTKNILVNLAGTLSNTMSTITNDFILGFGSFIEKPISPFMSKEQIKSNKAYSFQHHMKLSNDASTFASRVDEAETSDNLDIPEAGLEALMQAAVCTEQIGWRNNSQRLIIFSTDSPYHMSGDGKLAGILVPNDEKCHLSEVSRDGNKKYLYSLDRQLDYPSVSQISRQISANSINIIFAVPSSVSAVYEALSSRITGATLGELSDDSSNIVRLITEQYDKISSKVKLAYKAPEGVEVTFFSACQKGGKPIRTNECPQVKAGTEIEFEVTITVKQCRNGTDSYRDKIDIFPIGINDVLTIELDVVCECDCDHQSVNTELEKYCGIKKELKCADCECDPKIFKPACPLSSLNGEMCGGSGHGTCSCGKNGKCDCADGWTGVSCDCSTDDSGCRHPENKNVICSGRGNCNCGKCVCGSTDEGKFTGNYCETIPLRCAELKDCVRCKAFQTGLSEENCNKCNFNVTIQDEVEVNEDETLCLVEDGDLCHIVFVYKGTKLDPVVRVRKLQFCTEPPNVAAIAGGILGAILGIGLFLLLLWKILTTVHDRMEYAKFLEERKRAKWQRDENPLYKRPTTIFSNPAYTESTADLCNT